MMLLPMFQELLKTLRVGNYHNVLDDEHAKVTEKLEKNFNTSIIERVNPKILRHCS